MSENRGPRPKGTTLFSILGFLLVVAGVSAGNDSQVKPVLMTLGFVVIVIALIVWIGGRGRQR